MILPRYLCSAQIDNINKQENVIELYCINTIIIDVFIQRLKRVINRLNRI